MSESVQHVLVLALVGLCGAIVLVQAIRSLRGRGRLGSCCAKGCEPKTSRERVAFMPVEMLSRRR